MIYTIKDLARAVGVHPAMVRTWINRADIPPANVRRGKMRISPSTIAASAVVVHQIKLAPQRSKSWACRRAPWELEVF